MSSHDFFSTLLLQNNQVRLPNVQPLAINQAVTVSENAQRAPTWSKVNLLSNFL